MKINEDTWRQFVAIAQAIYLHHKIALDNISKGEPYCKRYGHDHLNHEPDIFDVFNLIRERELGGWSYTESMLRKLDAEIDREYKAGKW